MKISCLVQNISLRRRTDGTIRLSRCAAGKKMNFFFWWVSVVISFSVQWFPMDFWLRGLPLLAAVSGLKVNSHSAQCIYHFVSSLRGPELWKGLLIHATYGSFHRSEDNSTIMPETQGGSDMILLTAITYTSHHSVHVCMYLDLNR